jgi:hypothetical protein
LLGANLVDLGLVVGGVGDDILTKGIPDATREQRVQSSEFRHPIDFTNNNNNHHHHQQAANTGSLSFLFFFFSYHG